MPIPAPQTSLILLVSCPVRGASRGDPEVGQSESWPEGATLKVDAAPADVPRKHGLGGPWVTVRAHYEALPSVAGRDRRRVGESLPGWRACSRLRSEVRSQGRRSRCDGASERRFCYYQGASIGAPSPLKKGRST